MSQERKVPQLFNLREVCALVKMKPTAIYEHVKDGTFPAPIKPTKSGRAKRSTDEQIIDHIASRVADGDKAR